MCLPAEPNRAKWPDTAEGSVGEASKHSFTGSKGEVKSVLKCKKR